MSELVALRSGDKVGRYTIEREIGRGGMGIVYLATNAKGQKRAIKTLVFAGKLTEQLIKRFLQEILLMSSIEHAHVVRFYEAGKLETPAGTTLWIALEYLEGETLRALIGRQPQGFEPETVARMSLHIAEGVHAAHKLGIVHRDLKPENAALSGEGETVKVFDLGIAKWSGAANPTAENLRIGTLGYMAPEQIDRKIGPIDARTDVHAIGVILYELATGSNPLCPADELVTPQEAQARVLAYEPPPLAHAKPGFPTDLGAIADRCLKKNPAARYQTARELADALDDVLGRLRAQRHSAALANLGLDAGAARRAKTSSADATPPPVVNTPRGGFTPHQPATRRVEASDATRLQWIEEARASRESRGEASPLLDRAMAAPTAPLPRAAAGSVEPTPRPGAGSQRIATGTEISSAAPGAAVTGSATPVPQPVAGAFPMRLLFVAVAIAAVLGVAAVAGYRAVASNDDTAPIAIPVEADGDAPSVPREPEPATVSVPKPGEEEPQESSAGGATAGSTATSASASATAAPPPRPVAVPPPRWPPPKPKSKPDIVVIE